MVSSGISALRFSRSMLSRTLDRNGVQLIFLQLERDSGVGTLGITTVVSFFNAAGHCPVLNTALKIVVTSLARRGWYSFTTLGSRSPSTAEFGFLASLSFLVTSATVTGGLVFPGTWPQGTRGAYWSVILVKNWAALSPASTLEQSGKSLVRSHSS